MRVNFSIFGWQLTAGNSAASIPVFRWLSAGSALNAVGMQGEQIIIGLLVYQITDSSAWVGISLALFYAPMLFIGVPAGALADRYDRRRVLVATELALATVLLVFAALLFADIVVLESTLIISVLSGALRAVHHPAKLSLAGVVVAKNDMVPALGLLNVVSRFGQLAGALGAGAVGELLGPGSAYVLLGCGHLIALMCFYRIDSVDEPRAVDKTKSVLTTITEYFHLLGTGSAIVLLVALASLVEIFGFSFATALPEIAVERLSIDAGGLGVMHAVRASGGLFGALLLSLIAVRFLGIFYLIVMVGFGVTLICLAHAPDFVLVLIAIAFVAVFASATDILVQGMLQLSVPEQFRGRAMGAWVVALGMGPLGHLELGWLIAVFGVASALSINGVILMISGLAAMVFCHSIIRIRSSGDSVPN